MTGGVMVGFLPITARRLYAEGMTAASLFWRCLIGLVVIGLSARLAGVDLARAGHRGAFRSAARASELSHILMVKTFPPRRHCEE